MSSFSGNVPQNGNTRKTDSLFTVEAIEEMDFSKLLDKPKPLNMARQGSCDQRSFSDFSAGYSPRLSARNPENSFRNHEQPEYLFSPCSRRSVISCTPRSQAGFEPHPMVVEAWENLRRSLVFFRGDPVGTIAATDTSDEKLNYDQVFVRDFVPSALAFLMNGEPEVVKNFLLKTLRLQSWEKKIDRFHLSEGVMPASFKVLHDRSCQEY